MEVRLALKPYLGQRVKIRGTLSQFDTWQDKYREVGRACIANPEIDHELVASHVWVMGVPHWQEHKHERGRQIEFSALVKEYTHSKTGERNYCLVNPDDLIIKHAAPVLPIPDPIEEESAADEELPEEFFIAKQQTPSPATDPLQTVRHVKAFAKECGGLEQAERFAVAFRQVTVPISELLDWLKVLKEE